MKRPIVDIPTSVKDPELVKKRRGQIIRAATRLFAQKGFHKTTIRDIAEKSGLSMGAIYEYIRTKEEVVVLNQDLFLESAGARLRQCIENVENPLEKLRRLIHTELHMMDRHADYLLFLTRERHYLTEKYGSLTLQLERTRLSIFDEVLEECIATGHIPLCNVRLVTQLIKVMIDSWVMKGWDLREHADIAEMEATIVEILWNGLPGKAHPGRLPAAEAFQLEGKSVFVANGGTLLGRAMVAFLVSKGARPTVYACNSDAESRSAPHPPEPFPNIRVYSSRDYGPLDANLFKRIMSDMKELDVYLHDLGIGNTRADPGPDEMAEAGRRLEANLKSVQETAECLLEFASTRSSARCIYLAPWSWDRHANPIRYEAVKGAVVALTRMMAGELTRTSANVHCIVPGYIRSEGSSGIGGAFSDELIEKIPFDCLCNLSDVTNALLFLASDASKFLTGQVLEVSREAGCSEPGLKRTIH